MGHWSLIVFFYIWLQPMEHWFYLHYMASSLHSIVCSCFSVPGISCILHVLLQTMAYGVCVCIIQHSAYPVCHVLWMLGCNLWCGDDWVLLAMFAVCGGYLIAIWCVLIHSWAWLHLLDTQVHLRMQCRAGHGVMCNLWHWFFAYGNSNLLSLIFKCLAVSWDWVHYIDIWLKTIACCALPT